MNAKQVQKRLIVFIGLILPALCGLYAQEREWVPAGLREMETKFLQLKAQADILDMFAPEKLPDFGDLEKTNQLVEQLEFNRRKFKLLLALYNQLEDTLFPFLLKYSKQHPERGGQVLEKVKEYTGGEEKSIILLQERLNSTALQVDRFEKKLERVQAAARGRALAQDIRQKTGETTLITGTADVSVRVRQLEALRDGLAAEIRQEEARLNRLKKKVDDDAAKIEEKRKELDVLKKEAASVGEYVEQLIRQAVIQVKTLRLNGLEIPRLNTAKTFLYLSENTIETLRGKLGIIEKELRALEARREREFIDRVIEFAVITLVVLVLVFYLVALIRRVGKKIKSKLAESEELDPHRKQRYQTLSSVTVSVVKVGVWVLAVLLVLGRLDIDYTPFLVAAGGISLAVGFGAQSLVKDVVTGFFILMEEQFALGDGVEINGKSGSVEKISLRTIRLRGLDGTLHIIPNSSIPDVSNMTYLWAQAVVKVGASYNDDPRKVLSVLETLCLEFAEDPEWKESLTEPPVAQGVLSFGESGINYRILAKTHAGKQWAVGRELHIRVKDAFDKNGIEIPYNYLNVIERKEKKESA